MTPPRTFAALGEVVQQAYLPSDFDAALRYWTETVGAGPFFLLENIELGDRKYRGEPTGAIFSVAIGYWGDLQIELCRSEGGGPSHLDGDYAVRDQLHHICLFVDDIAEARRVTDEAGAEVIFEGKVGDDGAVIYADAGGGPGSLIEMVQLASGGEAFFAMMRDAARNWDGSEPLRRLG